MSDFNVPLSRPQPTFPSIGVTMSQHRYVYPDVSRIPRKYFHFARSSAARTLGADWSMTTFDGRKEDQFYDPMRLQTIEETSEVVYFTPFQPLAYSEFGSDDLDHVLYIGHIPHAEADAHGQHNNLMKRLIGKTKSAVTIFRSKTQGLYHCLLP
ncbi:hypothetical protein M0805_007955 [Coniferiporia weirii]|nr:hypothetical protein M0805_007955 [Coniferiporia weirii]